jgi:hypothetical protein
MARIRMKRQGLRLHGSIFEGATNVTQEVRGEYKTLSPARKDSILII